ncbi:MAG: ATP-binding protein [Caldilineaceae bacterium SB0662_bin_9]|uniref:ATP-binding protein n=1 Tax=Caldilineaceae bacterium SB0662_bin_9 TaxID=2605258 RepID=A0A6B1DZ29_9CHLR|nr:ATP-binding protein [Caldilineaceae bacterium SB0662_bin_9]
MSTNPRPWLQCVDLHPDVLSDDFSEDIFALDLGSLSDYLFGKDLGQPDAALPRVPVVYRDADSFFAASYVTSGLKSLLEDVLGRLAGADGNRVLKLLTPFGGGKSHTLAALLHAARSRTALDALPEAAGLPRPEHVRVAVVDGQFFDATSGKHAPSGDFTARTIWGWIAWSLGGREGYELVRAQDEARVAPGGDTLVALLKGGPSLILIDELLEYLISAGGVRVEKTTLRDETLSFLKRLTVAVGIVDNAVLVYSLQSSKRESLEYANLLHTVEHLAARKDQRREPVEGNEILRVIQRRLLVKLPDATAAATTAAAYGQVFTQMRRAYAQGETERQQAEEEGLVLRDRIRASYPFHPALIDLMRERWAAIPDFQRTRGALRFLAACLRAAHHAGGLRLLLGPGDVPIHDAEVRLAFFKEVGQREDFQACVEHDFVGPNARSRRIDKRREREVTAEVGKLPATRLATTMLLYSFGGLRRGESDQGNLLPPGIGEPDLLGASIGPDLDTTTIQACLKELKEQCLYLHFDGVRYCFKKDPNVTLLVEQEAEAVARDESQVRTRIRQMIEERLAGQRAIVWPAKSSEVPDREPQFLVVYLPLEFALQPTTEQKRAALTVCEQFGNRQREFRNGLGLAVPAADQIEILRRAVRYLLAVERVQGKWREHNLTAAQKSQLKERNATEKAAIESTLLQLYGEVWLPKSGDQELVLDTVSLGGRPLQTTLDEKKHALIHQRLMELLMTVQRRVFGTVAPGKIVELFELGEDDSNQSGIATDTVLSGFYEFLGFPRLLSAEAVRKAIARGVETGSFGYVTGRPTLDDSGRYQINRSRVAFDRSITDDEIDLDSGFLMVPAALPERSAVPNGQTNCDEEDDGDLEQPGDTGGTRQETDPRNEKTQPEPSDRREIALSFIADQSSLYAAWNAMANLADVTGKISINAKATTPSGYDKVRLENGVLEPLRELGLIEDDIK